MQTAIVLSLFAFLSVVVIASFTFAAISSSANSKRLEREAFYRSEVIKRLTESDSFTSADVVLFQLEEGRAEESRRREKTQRAGLVTASTGIGLAIFLYAMLKAETSKPIYLVGIIPILIGVALIVAAFLGRKK